VGVSIAAQGTQRLSKTIGRVWATILVKTIGVSLLLLLTYMTSADYPAKFVVPVYLVRTALMNSSKPLTKVSVKGETDCEAVVADDVNPDGFSVSIHLRFPKRLFYQSIIMDVVPSNQRGRWNALESINAATWAGSAVFGGFLIDRYGIVTNFLVTAALQLTAMVPLMLVSCWPARLHATCTTDLRIHFAANVLLGRVALFF
jgi:hypothetical protein